MTGINAKRAVERCERLAALGPAPAWWRVFALRRWLVAYSAIMAMDIGEAAEMLREVFSDEHIKALAEQPNPWAVLDLTRKPGIGGERRRIDPVHQQRLAAAIARRGGR